MKAKRKPNTKCFLCGTPLYRQPHRMPKQAFCLGCIEEGRKITTRRSWRTKYKKYIVRWLAGEEDGMSGQTATSGHIQRWIREKHNGKCSQCGWNEINQHTGKCPVELEHIDGDFRNNRPENLTLLCPNCHSLTATYKGANRGRGRPR